MTFSDAVSSIRKGLRKIRERNCTPLWISCGVSVYSVLADGADGESVRWRVLTPFIAPPERKTQLLLFGIPCQLNAALAPDELEIHTEHRITVGPSPRRAKKEVR